jgi:hypothetical protein
MMGNTKKMRKVSKGKAVSRKDMHAAMPKGGMMEASNKVGSGTRLAKVFRAMVRKHAK